MSEYVELTDADVGLAGIEKSRGYQKMKMAAEDPPKELAGEVYESHREGVFKAVNDALSRRDEEDQAPLPAPAMSDPNAEPIERQYNDFKTGEKLPLNQVVELDRAARDISGAREAEQAEAATALDVELQQAIDALRSGDPEQPQQTPQQPQEQPVEPQPALEGDDVWQRPEVIAAFENYNNQVSGAVQAQQQQYADALQANASQATAAIFAAWPELQGISTPEALIAAVAVIERQNPQRGQQLKNHIATVQQLSAKAQEVQQRQVAEYQQQHRQQFDHVASLADTAFDAWLGSQEPPERMKEISSFAKQMLKDEGLSDQEISHHYNTSPIFRSLTGQRILADAARYRMAQQIARGKAVRQIPTVQRPGSPLAHEPQELYDMRKLGAQLDRSGSVKDATALLVARRGRR